MRRIFLLAAAVLLSAPSVYAQTDTVTFTRDIAPLLATHCAGCHRPGEVGPFDLLTYRDARQHASQIARVTAQRLMPPWKPDPNGPRFLDSRALSDAQIRLIQDWVAQGSSEGTDAASRDIAEAAAPSAAAKAWLLGTPDLVVTMSAPYLLAAGGPDAFRTFVLPIPLAAARYVRALEFDPGNRRAVHHANLGIDRTAASRLLDERDPLPGYSGGIVSNADYPPGQMLGWTPGQRPRPAPAGTQWRLDPVSDLVVQLHLQPTGKPEPVQVRVGLYFTSDAPTRTPVGIRMGRETIDIAPGDRSYIVADSYVLPVDVDLLAIQPHAHNLARQMTATATLPNGTKQPLLTIADWDFRWQEIYRYVEAPSLPKGTTITMRYTYDNSAANPRNPHSPPQRVVFGQNTANEMGDLWLQVVPRTKADLAALSSDVARKMRAEDLAANLLMLKSDPTDPGKHDTVAIFYLQDGQLDQAVAHFRESIRLKADAAPPHYNLGLAYLAMQRMADATSELREAIRLDPRHADAHNSLGAALHAQGRQREAADEYRRSASLRADHAGARTNLAWILAASSDDQLRNPAEAIRVAEEAVTLTHREDASALDALGAAYASAGQFDRAIASAQAAARHATDDNRTALATQINQRLALYQRGIAYRLQ